METVLDEGLCLGSNSVDGVKGEKRSNDHGWGSNVVYVDHGILNRLYRVR